MCTKESGPLLASATTSTPRLSKTHVDKLPEEERKARRKITCAKYYQNNKAVAVEARKNWRDANPEATKNIALKTKYGITLLEKDALFRAQGSVCAICETDTPTSKGWHVDHCHTTQKVRGVLCHHCNTMLGNARDNPDTLLKAVTYLGKQNG